MALGATSNIFEGCRRIHPKGGSKKRKDAEGVKGEESQVRLERQAQSRQALTYSFGRVEGGGPRIGFRVGIYTP